MTSSTTLVALELGLLVLAGGVLGWRRRCRAVRLRAFADTAAAPPPQRYAPPPPPLPAGAPTALLVVDGYTRSGLALLRSLGASFAGGFKNVVLLSPLPGREDELENFVPVARRLGFHVECRCAAGLEETLRICREIHSGNPQSCVVLARALLRGSESAPWVAGRIPAEALRVGLARSGVPFLETTVSLNEEPDGAESR